MNREEQHVMAAVIRQHRWGALATQGDEGPECSWVAYAAEADFSGFLLFLSNLAAHTRNLLRDPRASLGISEQESEGHDPQQLARVMIHGEVLTIDRNTQAYAQASQLYRERLPDSARLFELRDFLLFRLRPVRARFVGGFGRIFSLDAGALSEASRRLE